MPPAGNQQNEAVYRPISRKYLRYLLEGLNDEDSGAGTFAQLAVHLIHRRKCANVVPATEPSAGGDLGQDARTQQVILDTDGRFRLYASPPTIAERWIFAFSIRQDWQAKLASDAAKIIANGLGPDTIIFVTNQFIHPEHRKIDEERAITERYGVGCEILDGQWILDQLYEDDYLLAVEFLGCPPESDPRLMETFQRLYGLQEGGLTEDEAHELEQLKQRVQYRNRYIDTPEHLLQDILRIGNILAPYEAFLEEAIQWYEEGFPELDRITHLPDGIELLYAYFKALRKLPDGPTEIFAWLPKFIDMVFASEARALYHYTSVWLHTLFPSLRGQEPFDTLYRTTLERFHALDRSGWGLLSHAYLDETILFLEYFLVYNQEQEGRSWLERVHAFLQRIQEVEAFPRGHIAGILEVLAPHLNQVPEYETCFDLAMELNSKQEGGFARATSLKNRALAHARAQQWDEAIIMASRAKQLWLNERSMRGYLLVTCALSSWYSELRYLQAAEYELLEGLHVITWQPTYMEPDLLLAMIVGLAHLALLQGRALRAFRWLFYYPHICQRYRFPPDPQMMTEVIDGNLNVLAMYLYTHNRPVHDRLLEIAESIDSNLLLAHREINLSSDEEFEIWLSDLTSEQQVESRNLRRKVHAGEKPSLEDWVEYDELAAVQRVEWHMPTFDQERLTIRITYPRNPHLAQAAFTLAATAQIWSVFLHRKIAELTIVDDVVTMSLRLHSKQEEPLLVATEFRDDMAAATLTMTPQYVERLSDPTSEGTIDLFLKSIGEVLIDITLDPPEEIVALFDPDAHGEAIHRLSAVAHPAYLWNKNAFAKTVVGVDDAS
jgi:hypothetical protein